MICKFVLLRNKMSKLSGIRDLDREILDKVDDAELLKVCSIDKYTWKVVCDDAFLRRRLSKYTEIEQYKKKRESWKYFFVKVVNCIHKLREKYGFDYTSGNLFNQYWFLKIYSNKKDSLFLESVKIGDLGLVAWSLKNGANIHIENNLGLRWASEFGYLN
jgi:hypothetical protein